MESLLVNEMGWKTSQFSYIDRLMLAGKYSLALLASHFYSSSL